MLESGDLRKGLKLEIDGDPYVIVQFEFVKPGKGQALYKCRLKNMITDSQFDRTFRSGEKFQPASLDEREMEYLYFDGETYCFMDTTTFAQEHLTPEQVGDSKDLMKENILCQMLFFNDKAIGLTLPNFVELKIIQADPYAKGDTATGFTKPVTLETGYIVQVPPFIEEGEVLRIDTRTGEYVERVKK